MNIAVFSREKIDNHPILKTITTHLEKKFPHVKKIEINTHAGLKELATFSSSFYRILIFSDPFCLCLLLILKPQLLFSRKSITIYFFSLEMYEFQIPSNSCKNIIRNTLFSILHFISLKISDKIIFPAQERCDFYKKKYALKNKNYIIPNVPSREKREKSNKVLLLSKNEAYAYISKFESNKTIDSMQEKPCFIYAGTISTTRGIDIICEAFEMQKKFKLIVLGKDRYNFFKNNHYRNSIYLGEKNAEHIVFYYRVSFGGILYYSNRILNCKLSASIKIHEYIDNQMLIIGNKNPGLEAYINPNLLFDTKDELVNILENLSPTKSNSKKSFFKNYEDYLTEIF